MPQELGISDLATFKNYKEVYSNAIISSNILTLNLNNGNIFNILLNANILTITISNIPSSTHNISFTIIFTADGTVRAVNWPNTVIWPSGNAPSITSTAGKIDVFSFTSNDGGSTWIGFVGGQNM
jgi:hypothetical protein